MELVERVRAIEEQLEKLNQIWCPRETVFVPAPKGIHYIFVNMDGGTGWYELEGDEKKYLSLEVCLMGILREIVVFEQTYNNKRYPNQIKVGLNFDTEKGIYQVRAGAKTVFTMSLVDNLRYSKAEQLKEPILLGIQPSEQNNVIFAKVYQRNGCPFPRSSNHKPMRLEVWEQSYLTELQNLGEKLSKGLRLDIELDHLNSEF